MADADLNNDARHEVCTKSDSKAAEDGQLLTPAYFQKWCAQHAQPLEQAREKRRQAVQDAENERLAKARNAVIGGVMRWMREGYTKAEAGKRLVHGYSDWGEYTYGDLLMVLREIGACPFGKPQEGGDA